jgi:ABC-2 type transport system ATP-binding protein
MEILTVDGLTKRYPKFTLDGVSFSLEKGFIMGFIGRNGAGKTTTLKSMVRLVHPDAGTVRISGFDFEQNEWECKQKIGFVWGGVDYYPKKPLKTIAGVTRRFFPQWDEETFQNCMGRFELDPEKRIDQLSSGMRVKFSLALALSHRAELLILDEPTSGLDPVSRDDLLGLFQELVEDGEHSILFSTHIISDLEKCSDFITYIKDGKILASMETDRFREHFLLIKGPEKAWTAELAAVGIGTRKHHFGFETLIRKTDLPVIAGAEPEPADLETIMIHIEREENHEKPII